jgi:hypothetical protein
MIELPYPPLSVSTQELLRFVSCSSLMLARNFAAALTRLGHPHDFAEFGIFHHVQVRPDIGVERFGDVLHLFRMLGEVLLVSS